MNRRAFITSAANATAIAALGFGAAPAMAQGSTATPASNDKVSLTPQPSRGHAELAFDLPGVEVGTAEYSEGPTGCTVLSFAKRAAVEVDIRGGAPATYGSAGIVDAICLAGGSVYGLEASAGVSAELLERRGYKAGWTDVALVHGAIIYDFGPRKNTIYPDKALGRAALRNAKPGMFPIGRCGAGCSATAGKAWFPVYKGEPAGQGGAYAAVGRTRVAVFTVVNALGAVVDRSGKVVLGNRDENGRRVTIREALDLPTASDPPQGNTTLTVVVTNQRLDRYLLRQLGRQVHSSMARAIQPFHGRSDGDVLYAVTTNEVEGIGITDLKLAAIASELAWDAVLSVVKPA